MIGICGFPTHGKSTAQRFLELLGVEPRDDAEELRRRACRRFGLTWEQVTTQAGKLEMVEAYGTTMTVRQVLGDFGQEYERSFGPNYWVELAVETLRAERATTPVSFGSLRRSQPSVIKQNGGFVIEILDPRKPTSKHLFDEFDRDDVDFQVLNDSSQLDLGTRVLIAVSEYLKITPDQAITAMARFEEEFA
jgi:hypothetical protein